MADIKREQELAEKRKNDPQLDLAHDHLVRKIFSKFRKPSDGVPSTGLPSRPGSSAPNSSDIEKGGATDRGAKQAQSEPESRVSSALKASKWAAALGNTSQQAQEVENALFDRDDHNLNLARRTELVCKKSEHIQVVKDIRPPTQGNKWPRVATGSVRHETIDEMVEDEQKTPTPTTPAATVGKAATTTGKETADSNKILVQPKSINSADYQQIVATLVDMRIDLKLEMQKLTNKIGKIDEHISNITKKLSTLNLELDDYPQSATASGAEVAAASTTTTAQQKFNSIKSVIGKNSTIKEVDEETGPVSPRTATSTAALLTKQRTDSSAGGTEKHFKTGTDRSGDTTGQQRTTLTHHHRTKPALPPSTTRTLVAAGRKLSKQTKQSDGLDEEQKRSTVVAATATGTIPDDEMKTLLENEIAQQQQQLDWSITDEDQDLTSKL